jgi:hypothetical protein
MFCFYVCLFFLDLNVLVEFKMHKIKRKNTSSIYIKKIFSIERERERENATRLMCRGEKGKIKINNRISALEPPWKPQHSAD